MAHANRRWTTDALARYQRDLPRIRSLGARAAQLDALFHHRVQRLVRKDGTVSYLGQRFEAPFDLAGRSIRLVVDPTPSVSSAHPGACPAQTGDRARALPQPGRSTR